MIDGLEVNSQVPAGISKSSTSRRNFKILIDMHFNKHLNITRILVKSKLMLHSSIRFSTQHDLGSISTKCQKGLAIQSLVPKSFSCLLLFTTN